MTAAEVARKGTVLIIDDEADVLFFLKKVFNPRGYETITASSGMEGLKMIQENGSKIDLVLLDLRMPGMGGLEVLKSIRKHQPQMPVIVLTAVHEREADCFELGIEAFVRKPYSLEDLYEKVERVVDRQIEEKSDVVIPENMQPAAKILIVDDEREVCELLAEALSDGEIFDSQFTVKNVFSGDEALRVSLEFEPDIAIVDIKMPHMWGDELIKRFKNKEGYCPKDFIIYTSVTDPKEVESARRLGHKMLSKPTHIDTVVEVLKKICVRHGLLKPKR